MFLRLLIFALIVMTNSIFAQTFPPLEPGVSLALAKWRAANYSDVRYKLNITLEKGAPLMRGDIEIRVNLTDAGAKNDLILDWRTTQFAGDKDKPYVSVNQVNDAQMGKSSNSNDKDLYWVENEHLIIEKRFLRKGENTIQISFASPIKTSGAAITRYVDKEDGAEYIYSLFVPSDASTAFPVFDQPDLKARFQLNIEHSWSWRVVSNTVSEELKSLPLKGSEQWKKQLLTSHFEETKPISTYVFAFAAGSFVNFREDLKDFYVKPENLPEDAEEQQKYLQSLNKPASQDRAFIYVRKSQAEKFKPHAAEVFRLNREGVNFLESYFDYKFPFPKYDLVLIPEFPFGGMEHAGATFLRESSVIFPTEPTKNDYVSRANVIFHEAAHQWFGDTVTMKWFDDLWLKEGFAEFMAYKTLEKVMPEYNAWKIFYERNKQAAYLTDSTKGTTPIYQEIPNLSAAKSAYGNIVYRKAPSFLKQAEFLLGEKEFQTAVRAFLKKHEFANAEWTDLVREFEKARGYREELMKEWSEIWIKQRGLGKMSVVKSTSYNQIGASNTFFELREENVPDFRQGREWTQALKFYVINEKNEKLIFNFIYGGAGNVGGQTDGGLYQVITINNSFYLDGKMNREKGLDISYKPIFIFPNYQDYGYGIFLLDEKSRAYVLANIQTEKDDFLRAMMWGSLWDSVRETELAPEDYVELVIKNINVETDESTIQTLLGRVSTAMNYYLSEPSASAGGAVSAVEHQRSNSSSKSSDISSVNVVPSANAGGSDSVRRLEDLLIDRMQNAATLGQRITFYRAFLNIAATDKARAVLKDVLNGKFVIKDLQLKTKDKFDIVTRLAILNDADAAKILADLQKTETSDDAKRYAYAVGAAFPSKEAKEKYFRDFLSNKEISESYIETAFVPFNSVRHSALTLPFLEKALAELPNLKKNRKIFFVNGWLGAFIGGQKSEQALQIVNKFLADNPTLDKDLRLKILENADGLERAVKIRAKY